MVEPSGPTINPPKIQIMKDFIPYFLLIDLLNDFPFS
jgi:hypothetical protein